VQRLHSALPGALSTVSEFRGELTVHIKPAHLRPVCEFLRTDPGLQFNFLADVTAVDRYPLEPRFEIVYQLLSLFTGDRVRLKAAVHDQDSRISSLVGLWPGADMLEREVFDLFGIRFDGHPHLRRLLMPNDWEGHPLRKDYPMEGHR